LGARWNASWWSLVRILWSRGHAAIVIALVLLEIIIVREVIIKFGIDNSFDKGSCVISQFLENLNDDIHDHWSDWWESHENSVNDLSAELLKLSIAIVKTIDGWFSELLKLRLQKIVEDIDRCEAANRVTFVHSNSAFNNHIRILL